MSKFYKVSYEQFKKDMISTFGGFELEKEEMLKKIYNNIKLPKRATKGSAGYDFFTPMKIIFTEWEEKKIPSGIGVKLDSSQFLMIVPRSGLGFKYYSRLANTVGIIDEDYCGADNEGHIFIKMRLENDTSNLCLEQGEAFAQGIIMSYVVTEDDVSNQSRIGGIGSTSNKLI